MKRHYSIPIFIPELGCPNRCVFCNQRDISGTMHQPSLDEVQIIIDKYLSTINKTESVIQIGFFGGSFTALPLFMQDQFLSIAQMYIDKGLVQSIRLSTRPDAINREIISLLARYSVETVELGAQSFSDPVLLKSGRYHSADQIIKASELLIANGFRLGLQIMIGLPGEDLHIKSIRENIEKCIFLGAKDLRIYPVVVIKDTALARMTKQGRYQPLSLRQTVSILASLLPEFEKRINIIRIGLHPSETLLNGDAFIAGPFHPSLRELIYSKIWRRIWISFIKDKLFPELALRQKKGINNMQPISQIIFEISPKEINFAIGHKKCNQRFLSRVLKIKQIKRIIFNINPHLQERFFHYYFNDKVKEQEA